ncbi:MAG: glutamate--tRNA ligase [Phycisphaerales bacterium]|nr:glutamate--tRNA ligase [Phycisphaerales bacterium]
MTGNASVRTRFAPSPTGHLHVGGARSALFCWAFARHHGGRFLLRIEDTDQKRSSEEAGLGFFQDLAWLGIDWDEGPQFESCGGGETGPYFQSERLEIYAKHFDQLIESGAAYPAFETTEELTEARREARANKQAYRYNRASLSLSEETIQQYLQEGRPHVLRFKVPDDREIVIEDAVLGEVRVSPGELEDFVIRKADGFPTYHFAVVVDDSLMKVTHVIRGQEHLANTPKHMLLQEALGFTHPVYAHVSLIFNPDGSKMSKRDKDKLLRREVRERKIEGPPADSSIDNSTWETWTGDKTVQLPTEAACSLAICLGIDLPEIDVADFQQAGYLPEVLLNYLALLGWSPADGREQFDATYLAEHFDLERIVKSPAKFDRDKLLAFNLDAIQDMSEGDFVSAFRSFCDSFHPEVVSQFDEETFAHFARANKERSKTLFDPIRTGGFFLEDDESITWEAIKPVRKALCNGEPCGYDRLEAILPVLKDLEDWTVSSLETVIENWAEANAEGNLGKVAQPIRVAVSGGPISPPIYDTLVILGKSSSIRRIERCLAARETLCPTA